MEISEQHFAENAEILEDFVLGRLEPGTLAQCEDHLRTCETCRQAVHNERIIAAGIKRAGRERLKERLGMLAGSPARRQIPWPHVLSVAAILIILVGVGIYQGWFATQTQTNEIAQMERPQLKPGAESGAQNRVNEQPPAPQVTARPSEPAARQKDAEQPHRQLEKRANGQDEKLGYVQAPTDRLEEAVTASKDKRRADIASPAPATEGGQQEYWANGTLITETMSKKETDEGKAAKTMMSGAARAADASRAKADAYGRITIDQRPASSLPAGQQIQQLYNPQTIQTLVRQSEGETQLTLYPASPFDSTKLHYARVQQVAPDSLVVQIGDQKIGYKLPAGVLRQGQTETSKAKQR